MFCSTATASNFNKRVYFATDLRRYGKRRCTPVLKHEKTVNTFLTFNMKTEDGGSLTRCRQLSTHQMIK